MKKHKNQAVEELKVMAPFLLSANIIIILSIVMIGFAFGFDYRLFTGLLTGNILAVSNFLLIGVTAGAITRTRQFKRGQFLGNFSYGARYIGIFVILAALLTFDLISPFTAVIPLFYPKLYYTIQALRGKYNDD